MKYTERSSAILLLQDGTIFYGKSAGKIGIATGEICFNTGMTGYQEIFTDPSYYGQLMISTNVHIGNYGIKEEESESQSIKIAGLVCRTFSGHYSRKTAAMSVQDWFVEQNTVVITDVDTRALVQYIRHKGAMNAIISSENKTVEEMQKILSKVPQMAGLELSSKVSTKNPYYFGNSNAGLKVAVLDVGVKTNTLRCLSERGCYVKVFPYNSTFAEMQSWEPDGYLISNGPGDPAAMPDVVKTLKDILHADVPLFGICLGHQLLAEACGITTYKMFNGHRGINHPVKNLITGKCEVTSQNHGFSVSKEEIVKAKDIEVTHVNLNDETIEGIKIKNKKAFSVQYHPESSPGPDDARYLFDEFVSMMKMTVKEEFVV
ncbi:MAG: glutamine-hydrolyzing carbamoyl-phosphate synthase small subunit [Bacteroidota bacterium]